MGRMERGTLETMLWTNVIGSVVLYWVAAAGGEVAGARVELSAGLVARMVLFGCSTFGGVLFYMRLVRQFGGVTTVLITTMRKIVSVVLSFVVFSGNVFSPLVAVSGLMIVAGSGVNTVAKYLLTRPPTPAATPAV